MTLQDTFYVVAIISFSMSIILLTSLVVLIFFIMKKFGQLADNVNQRVDAVGKIVDNPGEAAVDIGASIIGASIVRVKSMFTK